MRRIIPWMFFFAVLFLFFFELLTDFVEAIYAFGLMGTGIPPQIGAVLLLFSPLLLLLYRHGLHRRLLVGAGLLMVAARVVEVILPTQGRLFVASTGVAAFMFFFPLLLWHWQRERIYAAGQVIGGGFTLAIAASILLRAFNSGVDPLTANRYSPLSWLLAAFVAIWFFKFLQEPVTDIVSPRETLPDQIPLGFLTALALGIVSTWLFAYFVFASPNVIARWTEISYFWIVTVLMLTLTLFGLLMMFSSSLFLTKQKLLLLWNLLFVAALTATIFLEQVHFPNNPDAFPLFAQSIPTLPIVALSIALILSPVVVADFRYYIETILSGENKLPELGGVFSVGALFMLIMILGHVFTTVYDYIPLVGTLFRDRFWLLHFILGIVMLLPLIILVARKTQVKAMEDDKHNQKALVLFLALFGVFAITGIVFTAGKPAELRIHQNELKILTYNIQQGYSAEGQKNLDGQLSLISELAPDVIGLQESDTNRIATGNTDLVRYFADHLNMYSYYGPSTVVGTFGVALLSRFPIENPRTFYMFSEGEQTAAIEAQLQVDGEVFNIIVTHLGNEGPIVQQQAVMKVVDNKPHMVLMGDFNFHPDSEPYQFTIEKLIDAWWTMWLSDTNDQGINPDERIDYIFLSPDLKVEDIRFVTSSASDHPALISRISW